MKWWSDFRSGWDDVGGLGFKGIPRAAGAPWIVHSMLSGTWRTAALIAGYLLVMQSEPSLREGSPWLIRLLYRTLTAPQNFIDRILSGVTSPLVALVMVLLAGAASAMTILVSRTYPAMLVAAKASTELGIGFQQAWKLVNRNPGALLSVRKYLAGGELGKVLTSGLVRFALGLAVGGIVWWAFKFQSATATIGVLIVALLVTVAFDQSIDFLRDQGLGSDPVRNVLGRFPEFRLHVAVNKLTGAGVVVENGRLVSEGLDFRALITELGIDGLPEVRRRQVMNDILVSVEIRAMSRVLRLIRSLRRVTENTELARPEQVVRIFQYEMDAVRLAQLVRIYQDEIDAIKAKALKGMSSR